MNDDCKNHASQLYISIQPITKTRHPDLHGMLSALRERTEWTAAAPEDCLLTFETSYIHE